MPSFKYILLITILSSPVASLGISISIDIIVPSYKNLIFLLPPDFGDILSITSPEGDVTDIDALLGCLIHISKFNVFWFFPTLNSITSVLPELFILPSVWVSVSPSFPVPTTTTFPKVPAILSITPLTIVLPLCSP